MSAATNSTAPARPFFALAPDELSAWCVAESFPRHLADQLLDWVYRKGVTDPHAMTNVARVHRDTLADRLTFLESVIDTRQQASDGTQKLLLAWPATAAASPPASRRPATLPILDDVAGNGAARTECVVIPSADRMTACISSQVGCPVGCRFCASGLGGLERNLSHAQIVEQVFRLGRLPGVPRITNVVFMGMGEPLANFGAVTKAIRTINASWGLGIGVRKITISTVGLPGAIRKLAAFELPVTLALSLHAPNDELRRTLIPWAEYAPIDELLDACDEYFASTRREITLEYLLLKNVNDRPEHARQLARIAGRLRANVNLIRYNEVRGLPYDRPTSADVIAFQTILRERRVNTHIRASRGRDIAAACGQLRHERRADAETRAIRRGDSEALDRLA